MKKAAMGIQTKPKAKLLPKPGKQTPADFYPESYDKLPRTKGGGANYNGPKAGPLEKNPKGMSKNGGSFPDLNKDGKISQADILKGRGVIAKMGKSIKKAGMHKMPDGSMMKNSMMKKGGSVKKKMQFGGEAASMAPMKKGGSMKKCKYGCK